MIAAVRFGVGIVIRLGAVWEEKPGVSPAAHSPYHGGMRKQNDSNSCAYFVALHLQD
jgi:hypothetical protein